MTVCFFGHRDASPSIQSTLRAVLVDLIEHESADRFYVGNHGTFDALVRDTLRTLQTIYPHITYAVVLAYLPAAKTSLPPEDFSDTVYPEGLTNVPKKFAIDHRNRWMITQSDVAVCYVMRSIGGAAQYRAAALKSGLRVIDLAKVD